MTPPPTVPTLQAFAKVFASSGAVVLMSRVDDARIVAISPNFLQLLGISEDEAIGQTSVGLGLWRDEQTRRAILALLKKDGVAAAQPVSLRNKRGEHYDGLMNCCVIEFNGDPYLYTLVIDLRRYDNELQARAREMDSYRTLAMETAVGLYRRRCSDGQLIEANVALARLLGSRDADPLLSRARPVPSFPYGDPAKGAALQAQLELQGWFRNERAQWCRRGGQTLWVSESARLVRGDTGDPLYIEGTALDIGDLVQTETALQQSESLYRQLEIGRAHV